MSRRPHFAAVVGSRTAGVDDSQSDIDLFVILNDTDQNLQQSPFKCEALDAALKTCRKPGIMAVVAVPSFALLSHSVEMVRRDRRGDLLTFHVLIYPTFADLLSWERPFVASDLLAGLEDCRILVGRKSQIPNLATTKPSDFAREHSSLLSAFQDGYIYFVHLRDTNVDFALRYGLKQLRYCIRGLADAILRCAGIVEPRTPMAWGNILRNADRLPASGRRLLLELDMIRPEPPRQPSKLCNPNTLLRLYRAGWRFFCDCHPSHFTIYAE